MSTAASLDVDPVELRRRTPAVAAPAPRRGYAALYRRHTTQASEGCEFDFLTATAQPAAALQPADRPQLKE